MIWVDVLVSGRVYSWGEIESSGRKRSDVEKTENGINKVGSANGGFGRRSGGVCFVPPRKKVIVFFFWQY